MNSYFDQLKGLSPSQIDLMLRVQYNSSVTIRGSEIRTGKSLERKGLGKVRAVRGSDLHEFMDAETWAPIKAVLDEKNRQYNAWIDAGNDHSDFPGYVGIEGG